MWFCPLDGTLLQIKVGAAGTDESNKFVCLTCPYACTIDQPRTVKTKTTRKVVDDILGGQAAWANVDRTMTVCPACNHDEAYFLQMQIRSADEPMSIFYKCVKCSHQWNDK
jgi:DNA-directed RNA polymerase III subunit RPC11